MLACPPYCAPVSAGAGALQAGGGAPSVSIENVVASGEVGASLSLNAHLR